MWFGLLLAAVVLASGGALVLKPSEEPKACDDGSFHGLVDLVITWHTDDFQSSPETPAQLRHFDHLLRGVPDFLQTGALVENQREIMYLLRGAERFGLLNSTRMVYVIVSQDELETKGPPRDLNWEHPQLRLVSDAELGVTGMSGYTSKFASLQNIPGIGDWILLLQDDIFPTGKWDPAGVYDFVAKRPRVRLDADGFTMGWCGDGAHESVMEHGPWFVSRCRMAELEARYPDRYKRVRTAQNKSETHALDVQCLYDNTAATESWSTPTENSGFWTNCHVNAPCPGENCCRADTFTNPHSMFMNLQGPGISDDYPTNDGIHKAAMNWIHNEYSRPSRFERVGKF